MGTIWRVRSVRFSLRATLFAVLVSALALTIGTKFYDWYTAPATIPLADAVAAFNVRSLADSVGKHEPPLTSAEVVAAIRAQLPNLQASKKVKAVYAKIASTGRIPEDTYLHGIPGWSLDNQTHYTVWWINLNIRTGDNAGFGLRIRENNQPVAKPANEPLLKLNNLVFISAASPEDEMQ